MVKMLTGGLFRDYDEQKHGPLDLRFKRAMANAIKNMVEKQKNARRLLPTVSIGQERGDDLPDRHLPDDEKNDRGFPPACAESAWGIGNRGLGCPLGRQETKSLVGREAIPVLIDLLKDKEWLVRDYAVWTLGNIGPDAKTAIPSLTQLLNDKHEKHRKAAAEAFNKIRRKRSRNRSDWKRTTDGPRTGDQVRSPEEEDGEEQAGEGQ